MQKLSLNRINPDAPLQASSPTSSSPTPAQTKLLSELNDVQREAAAHINGPLLILAGAGSGKTRVLTYRIAVMLEQTSGQAGEQTGGQMGGQMGGQAIQPWHVLALTFTNKAAAEMKERIAHLVGAEKASRIWAGTFHSLFARILRREAAALDYTNAFTIYDADDSLSIIRSVMNTLGISQQQYAPNAVRSAISGAKNKFMSWQEYERAADSIFEKQAGLIYRDYERRLKLSNAMDFDDLLINMIRLLQQPAMLEKYQDQFRYILIDEYQDTNRAQYLAVAMLARKWRNICVVGDDAQSIYRWRGADIRNILDFERDYPDAKIVRLEQNYRSTKTILEAANNVINNNKHQLKKDLWTDNPDGEKIHVLRCRDDREEAEQIVQTIRKEQRTAGRSLEDFALLYRTNAQSQALEDALRRENMPYLIVGGVSFYKRKEVKDTLAYLRLVVNPNDAESLLRVVNEPARGLGETSLRHITAFAESRSIPLFEAFLQAESVPALQRRAMNAALDFAVFVQRFQAMNKISDDLRADELAKSLIDASGLLRMYEEDGSDEALDRWNNIQRILSHLAEYCERNPDAVLEQYLEEIALISDLDEVKAGGKHVTLMTMHAAKGLEFPVVFIAGMERGLFPLGKAEQQVEEMEEERRLFYVGITRARQQLYLTHTEKRYRFGELTYPTPSPFLSEIKADLLYNPSSTASTALSNRFGTSNAAQFGTNVIRNANDLKSRGFQPAAAQAAPKATSRVPFEDDAPPPVYSSTAADTPRLRPGMNVKHEMFGVGQVTNVSGSGQSAQVEVWFKSVGKKKLMLKFANLVVMD
jgi:DNA helicase-2/ATP-dependent DNA helicase PcrA